MLGRPPPVLDNKVPSKLDNSTPDNIDNKSDNKLEDNKLFAIQTGSVVENIYTDGIFTKNKKTHI